jgi:hypothetical protein
LSRPPQALLFLRSFTAPLFRPYVALCFMPETVAARRFFLRDEGLIAARNKPAWVSLSLGM